MGIITGIGLVLAFHLTCILIVIMPIALGVTLHIKINPKVHAEWGSYRDFLVTQYYRGFSHMTTPIVLSVKSGD
jgi:hypothetical protein